MSKIDRLEGELGEVHVQMEKRAINDALNAAQNASVQIQMIALRNQIQIERETTKAFAFLFDQFAQRVVRFGFIQRALTTASNDYNGIILTEASKPLDFSLLVRLVALGAIPEFAALANVCKLLEDKWKVAIALAKTLGKTIDLDKSSGSDGKNRSGAFAAANQVVKEVYDRTLEDQTNASVVVEGFTAALLIGRPMPLKLVQNFWLGARLLTLQPIAFTTAQNASNLLSEVILYDMLRAYTGKYVTMHGEGAGALMLLLADKLDLEEVPSNFVGVNGLNPDQREMIYKRFSTVPWKDTSRPPVNSWRDLINKWGAKRIRPAGFPQDN